jgi:hypothetical protein
MALRAGYGSKMKSVEGGEDVFSGRVWERLGCLGKVFVADHARTMTRMATAPADTLEDPMRWMYGETNGRVVLTPYRRSRVPVRHAGPWFCRPSWIWPLIGGIRGRGNGRGELRRDSRVGWRRFGCGFLRGLWGVCFLTEGGRGT